MASYLEPCIRAEGTDLPSLDTVLVVLQHCRKEKSSVYAKHVQMCIHNDGLETHVTLGNRLVSTLVDCGSLSDAQQVFYRLAKPNEHSWTSLIQGLVNCGEHQRALWLFNKMQEVQVSPSGYTFSALLDACGQLKHAEEGHTAHLNIVKQGVEKEHVIGSNLVNMYAKCGLLAEARSMFDGLITCDVWLWTALLIMYVEHGLNEEALGFLEEMQQQGVAPNDVTLVCSLKACRNLDEVNKGRVIHDVIAIEGYEGDPFIGNILVDFYVNCGMLLEAQEVFDGLLVRDTVSWTALISGYAEQGFAVEALSLFEMMLLEGLLPNAITYFSCLRACAMVQAFDNGKALHLAITKEGLEQDYLVSSTLIDFYAKCGSLLEAQVVLDGLPVRNAVLWTALITGYAEHGFNAEAWNCFGQMALEGVEADAATFVTTLKVCGSLGSPENGQDIHAKLIKDGFEQNMYVSSTLVDMYAKCGLLAEAQAVSDEMAAHCVVSYTALIDGYADHGSGHEALKHLLEMQTEGLSPNAYTFVSGLKACMAVGSIVKAQQIHSSIVKSGFEKDLLIVSTLVDLYTKCGFLAEAERSFDGLPTHDAIVWNSLITGYVECGHKEQALDGLKQMQVDGISPSASSWNALLVVYADLGDVDEARELHTSMLNQGSVPDVLTFVSILKACGNTAALQVGKLVHAQAGNLTDLVAEDSEVVLATALVDMYSKCGEMTDAQLVFDMMPRRDHMAWATLLAGYSRKGTIMLVGDLFDRMRDEGFKPDDYTFYSLLSACSHAGQVVCGLKYFEIMSTDFGITPDGTHQNCIVDILSRAGQLNEAVVLLERMVFQPDTVTWNTFLVACHCCADMELGQEAFKRVTYLDEKDGAAFVLMSNLYANYDVDVMKKYPDEM